MAKPRRKASHPSPPKKPVTKKPAAKKSTKSDFDSDKFYFLPLGGSEQFGMNLNVYICDGQLLAVDCGIGFADERFPGIDLLIPDPAFLERHEKKLQALIITHAHEDHIGAVAHLWDRFECPIYCTPFTAAVLREKLKEIGVRNAPIHEVLPGETIKRGLFEVKFIAVAHSVPGSAALVVKTHHGNVLHSGDWNLDPTPVIGTQTDAASFKAAGESGIIAYVGDSTNAQVPGVAGTEADVEKGLYEVFKTCKGKIAVTMFASNIGRIQSISRAAKRVGRDVGIIGRSLHRMIGCAQDCGYLRDLPKFVSEDDLGYLPDDRTVMIVTGSQGEARAALAKISRGENENISFGSRDTVIFSSRPIPGNEREINAVRNALAAAGVRVVTPQETESIVHVSGHPCRDEIAQMLQWVRPNTVIPVHGERMQLQAHAELATQCQVPHVVIPANGSLIQLAPGQPHIVDHLETGVLAVDQKRVISVTHQSIVARRKLQYTGAVHVSVVLDDRDELVAPLKLDTIGLIDPEAAGESQIEDRLQDEIEILLDEILEERSWGDDKIAEELRIGIRRFVMHILGIKPKVTVHLIRI